ncbi:unnamed protein product, partial [marine sediment metagenome]
MQDFIKYLKKEKIIDSLNFFYKDSSTTQANQLILNKLLENLISLENIKVKETTRVNDNLNRLEYDIFSKLYENTLNHKEKKKMGEFYTPISIVNYILSVIGYNSSNNIEDKTIIDISCGSGSFIIQAIRILIIRCLEIYGKKKISQLTTNEAKAIISKVNENIVGVDVNRNACILCQINIYFAIFEILKLIRKADSNYQ